MRSARRFEWPQGATTDIGPAGRRIRVCAGSVLPRGRTAGGLGMTGSGEWRSSFSAIIASDVHDRDGIGWEFSFLDQPRGVWAVFRDDAGPFPVFSSVRGAGSLPAHDQLEAMTAS